MAKQKTSVKNTELKTLFSADQLKGLRKWNIWLGALLVLQAVAIIIIGTSRAYPVTTEYLSVDTLASEATGGETLAVATRHLFDARFAWVVVLFMLVFAAAYLLTATLYRKRYERRLQTGMNEARWAMFGAGGGMILVAVGLLSGIYELASLLALFAFMVVGGLAILAAEELARREGEKGSLLAHLLCGVGVAAAVMPLIIIGFTKAGALLFDGKVPGFMYGIYAAVALFFIAVALLTHFRVNRKGAWADAFKTERAYMVLGFAGASVLAWQMFAGALQP